MKKMVIHIYYHLAHFGLLRYVPTFDPIQYVCLIHVLLRSNYISILHPMQIINMCLPVHIQLKRHCIKLFLLAILHIPSDFWAHTYNKVLHNTIQISVEHSLCTM